MFLGRALREWKGLALGLVILGCGIVIGDAYRRARDEELLRISRVSVDVANLNAASLLLMAMKNNSAGCARTLIQDKVEEHLLYARADSASHPTTGTDIELDMAIKLATQILSQKYISGLDISQGCDVAKK